MNIEVGTLEEIGAKVGDVVGNIDFEDAVYYVQAPNDPYGQRGLWASTEKVHTKGTLWNSRESGWRIISRANQGPVREVTTVRKEIVPGVYGPLTIRATDELGPVQLEINGSVGRTWFSKSDVDALLTTLTAIRDAMPD